MLQMSESGLTASMNNKISRDGVVYFLINFILNVCALCCFTNKKTIFSLILVNYLKLQELFVLEKASYRSNWLYYTFLCFAGTQ